METAMNYLPRNGSPSFYSPYRGIIEVNIKHILSCKKTF